MRDDSEMAAQVVVRTSEKATPAGSMLAADGEMVTLVGGLLQSLRVEIAVRLSLQPRERLESPDPLF